MVSAAVKKEAARGRALLEIVLPRAFPAAVRVARCEETRGAWGNVPLYTRGGSWPVFAVRWDRRVSVGSKERRLTWQFTN
jgi:hypothetical protein